MNIDIKDVHVGQAIDQRRNELGLSKSELGRRLGIPQQHINRLLERETMETKRLVKFRLVLPGQPTDIRIPRGSGIGRGRCQ